MHRKNTENTLHLSRRQLMVSSLAAGAAALFGDRLAALAQAASPVKPGAQLRLCSQEVRIPGKNLQEKLENLRKFGGVAMEFMGNTPLRVKEIKEALAGSGMKMAAVCAGYFPLIDPNPALRKKGIQQLMKVLDAAGELSSTGVIVVPAFNQHPQLDFEQGRKALLESLVPLGEYAAKAGTRILLEPLNRKEARFLRQLAPTAAICRDARSPGVCMMGDFYHMSIEEKDDEAAFVAAGEFLHHVHLASTKRILPGQDDRSFVAGFRGLKRIGYQDFCSLECGVLKGTDPMVEIPKAFELLKAQWELATV